MAYSDDQEEEEVMTTVLVVGAGPVGLTAAVECLRNGCGSVMTIDKLEHHEKVCIYRGRKFDLYVPPRVSLHQ